MAQKSTTDPDENDKRTVSIAVSKTQHEKVAEMMKFLPEQTLLEVANEAFGLWMEAHREDARRRATKVSKGFLAIA